VKLPNQKQNEPNMRGGYIVYSGGKECLRSPDISGMLKYAASSPTFLSIVADQINASGIKTFCPNTTRKYEENV
jgi:hypothetical protein